MESQCCSANGDDSTPTALRRGKEWDGYSSGGDDTTGSPWDVLGLPKYCVTESESCRISGRTAVQSAYRLQAYLQACQEDAGQFDSAVLHQLQSEAEAASRDCRDALLDAPQASDAESDWDSDIDFPLGWEVLSERDDVYSNLDIEKQLEKVQQPDSSQTSKPVSVK